MGTVAATPTSAAWFGPPQVIHNNHHNSHAFTARAAPSVSPENLAQSMATLDYRPAVILPGLGNNSNDYHKLKLSLKQYGVTSVVAKVSRLDWLRNAAGLLEPDYWRGTLRPRPVLDWYLERVHDAVTEAKLHGQGGKLSLIGHSAGGWLARVYMEEFERSHISLLLTLGSPHRPPPKDLPGVIDQTRGLLDYVEGHCAKAVYTPQFRYVCIAGRYIKGARLFDNFNLNSISEGPTDSYQPVAEAIMNKISRASDQTMTEITANDEIHITSSQGAREGVVGSPRSFTSIATAISTRFIGQGYKQVCGQADVWGDGVVPVASAHLEGALNINLDGVYHSPVGSDDTLRPWYGSPDIVGKWIHHLLS